MIRIDVSHDEIRLLLYFEHLVSERNERVHKHLYENVAAATNGSRTHGTTQLLHPTERPAGKQFPVNCRDIIIPRIFEIRASRTLQPLHLARVPCGEAKSDLQDESWRFIKLSGFRLCCTQRRCDVACEKSVMRRSCRPKPRSWRCLTAIRIDVDPQIFNLIERVADNHPIYVIVAPTVERTITR